MDLNQLKTFVMVAETANLTKASELLFLSQPAVSAQIKALESEFGVELFQRTARGMILTVAGQAMKQDAIKALAAAKGVLSRAQNFRNGVSGECRIGTISEPVILRLGELLSHLTLAHPNLSLRLTQSISGIVIESVLEGRLHGGFVLGDVNDLRIVSMPIHTITLRVVGPFAWRNRILNADWEEIAEHPWIGMPAKCSFHRTTANLFARHGLSPHSIIEVDQESTVRQMVKSGLGLALIREDVALDAEEKQEVAIWPKGMEKDTLNFIYLKSETNSPIVPILCEGVNKIWDRDLNS